jgi:hypothetical protein
MILELRSDNNTAEQTSNIRSGIASDSERTEPMDSSDLFNCEIKWACYSNQILNFFFLRKLNSESRAQGAPRITHMNIIEGTILLKC